MKKKGRMKNYIAFVLALALLILPAGIYAQAVPAASGALETAGQSFGNTDDLVEIRVEGSVALASLTAQTNYITAQAAAKALGSTYGQRVIDVSPPLVLPSFARARLVPFSVGASGRYGMSNLRHIRSLLGLLGRSNGAGDYLSLLGIFDSDGFRAAAEAWYSQHGHTDADGCRPPGHGTERGGGTPYGI